MLCDNCIVMLANTISVKGQIVFNAIVENGKLNRQQIQKITKLSYSICSKAIDELENKLFIAFQRKGLSKVYWLTKIGARLIVIMNRKGVAK